MCPSDKENERVTEIHNDYGAINRYVAHVLDRQLDLLKYKKAMRLQKVLLGVSTLIIAIGIASWLILDGGARSPESQQATSVARMIEENKAIKDVEPAEDVKQVTVEYTVFKSVTLQEGQAVVTGYTFLPENPSYPSYQYCYHSEPSIQGKSIRYDLANKQGENDIRWIKDAPNHLRVLGKKHCSFR